MTSGLKVSFCPQPEQSPNRRSKSRQTPMFAGWLQLILARSQTIPVLPPGQLQLIPAEISRYLQAEPRMFASAYI